MATVQLEEIRESISSDNLDIEKFVREATWKDLLIELVSKNQLNPWDIDIVEVIDKYISAVKEMKVLDLAVPANIMLAAAMLVRFKSDLLMYEEQHADAQPEEDVMPMQHQPVAVEPLTFRLRLPPKRRVSLMELITALDEAMQIKKARETGREERPIPFPITFNAVDIEAEIEKVYEDVKRHVDSSRMTTFSYLCRSVETSDVILGLFIPLLFLAHKNRITMLQERFFDEIIIALN